MKYLRYTLVALAILVLALFLTASTPFVSAEYDVVCDEDVQPVAQVAPYDNGWNDPNGHGTHTSGTFAASTNNGIGVAGVGYNARIMPVKGLAANGSGDHGALASAIRWAADHGAQVINMSWGGAYGSDTLKSAIDYACARAVCVAAAGNDGSRQDLFPASYAGVISVCATDANDQRASFSNYASSVSVCAPGVGILSTTFNGGYGTMSGTSMASPNVAGVAALVLAAHPSWTPAQVKTAIENGADPVIAIGHGRVNAGRSVGAGGGSPSPQPTLVPTSTPGASPLPSDAAMRVFTLINQARADNGLGPLRYDARLGDAADFHNRFMRDSGGCFSHQCPGEPDPYQRMRNAGYPLISGGENIGKNYQSAEDMMAGWMNSSGHRAAILNSYWPDAACGYLKGPSGWETWWSCEFGKSSDSPPPTAIPTRTSIPPTATRQPIPQPTISTPAPFPTRTPVVVPSSFATLTWYRLRVNQASSAEVARIVGELCGASFEAGCRYVGSAGNAPTAGVVEVYGAYFTAAYSQRVERLKALGATVETWVR